MFVEKALKNPEDRRAVGEAISAIANYIRSANIQTIRGNIRATPTDGNAPLTVSLDAVNVMDPSGTTPPAINYIWWIRENGGKRRELGR